MAVKRLNPAVELLRNTGGVTSTIPIYDDATEDRSPTYYAVINPHSSAARGQPVFDYFVDEHTCPYDLQTRLPYHVPSPSPLLNINTNVGHSSVPRLGQAFQYSNRPCQPMYGSGEGGDNHWKIESPELECPDLISGSGENVSPTTTIDSWATFVPRYSMDEVNIILPQGNSQLVGHSPDYHQPEIPLCNGGSMPMHGTFSGSFNASQPSYNSNSNSYAHSDLNYAQWAMSDNLLNAAGGDDWCNPHQVTPQASFSTGTTSSVSNFPQYDSTFASAQDSFGYDVPMELPATRQNQHVVPGLLSSDFVDEEALGSFSFIQSPTSSAFDDSQRSSQDDDSQSGSQSPTPAPVLKEDILPSQTEDGDEAVHLPKSLTRRRQSLSAANRDAQDRYLIECRAKGLSYKEIKRLGGFKEAESTLRGRLRILSKPKAERVRKPQWSHSDISLLRRAVTSFTITSSPSTSQQDVSSTFARGSRQALDSPNKIPWKKVAEWLHSHGASYHFAPATCARKWEQLLAGNERRGKPGPQ